MRKKPGIRYWGWRVPSSSGVEAVYDEQSSRYSARTSGTRCCTVGPRRVMPCVWRLFPAVIDYVVLVFHADIPLLNKHLKWQQESVNTCKKDKSRQWKNSSSFRMFCSTKINGYQMSFKLNAKWMPGWRKGLKDGEWAKINPLDSNPPFWLLAFFSLPSIPLFLFQLHHFPFQSTLSISIPDSSLRKALLATPAALSRARPPNDFRVLWLQMDVYGDANCDNVPKLITCTLWQFWFQISCATIINRHLD